MKARDTVLSDDQIHDIVEGIKRGTLVIDGLVCPDVELGIAIMQAETTAKVYEAELVQLRTEVAQLKNNREQMRDEVIRLQAVIADLIEKRVELAKDQEPPETLIDELEYPEQTCNDFRWGVRQAQKDIMTVRDGTVWKKVKV